MIICTRCGHPAHVVEYGDEHTRAIRVICRFCKVQALKVGGRRSVVVEDEGGAACTAR